MKHDADPFKGQGSHRSLVIVAPFALLLVIGSGPHGLLDSDKQLQFRFSMPAQMPLVGALFVASSACPGMSTKKVWSYTLTELNGMTNVTVEPVWEYPDDYCQVQTQPLIGGQSDEIAAFQAILDKAH